MKVTTPMLLAAGLALIACSESTSAPEPKVEFRKVANVALYSGASYKTMLLYTQKKTTAAECEKVCRADEECNFFYYNERGGLNITPLVTEKDECAFFRGKLWAGTSTNSDTYVKQVGGVDAWDL